MADYLEKNKGFRVVIEEVIGQKDRVPIRMTHWDGNKAVSSAIAMYRCEGGKIVDDWAAYTTLK